MSCFIFCMFLAPAPVFRPDRIREVSGTTEMLLYHHRAIQIVTKGGRDVVSFPANVEVYMDGKKTTWGAVSDDTGRADWELNLKRNARLKIKIRYQRSVPIRIDLRSNK